jgi:hypothetical protein
VDGDTVTITAELCRVSRPLPTPLRFVVLRVLCLTVMRFRACREAVKRGLVRLLISKRGRGTARIVRTIRLGHKLSIEDDLQDSTGQLTSASLDRPFSAIHMASAGYWQRQDDTI